MRINIFLFFLLYPFFYSQIIIGDSPEIFNRNNILQLQSSTKGVLFPVVKLESRTSQNPLKGEVPTGTFIYNTNNFGSFPDEVVPGFFWWDNENKQWNPMASSMENFTAKFSNSYAVASSESGPTKGSSDDYYDVVFKKMKLFGKTEFNENYDALVRENEQEVRFEKSGLYAITVNLTLNKYTDNPAIGIRVYLALDGSQKGSSHYVRSSAAASTTTGRFFSNSFTEYIEVQQGQKLSVFAKRATLEKNTSWAIGFDSVGSSNVIIRRIR